MITGSTMTFSANILPVFEQLGLLDELKKISFPLKRFYLKDMDMGRLGDFDFRSYEEKTGYNMTLFARPELHQMLLEKIPKDKLLMKKKVMSFVQNENGVHLRCADGTTYEGDILIGADGAYSSVRRSMYEHLEKENMLPKGDRDGLECGHLCMVGVTKVLDPEKYPALKSDISQFERIMAPGTTHSWATSTVPNNRVCWLLMDQLDAERSKAAMFKNSEWGPESHAEMLQEYSKYPSPIGGTMSDVFDATPSDMISKVFLECKLFETWHYGRTALLGDACHKFLPSGGQGAVNAMEDAVVLANIIYELPSLSQNRIEAALKDYREQRYHHVKPQMDKSKFMGKIAFGQTLSDRIARHIAFNWVPKSVQTAKLMADVAYRPQCNFLPRAENRGTVQVLPQKPSKRYQAELAKRENTK
ncbi:hypothetical protein BG011_008786 [Mortierella polycephala]|uniref:FAD-binding domain-containing protein n=1 Tax=Mortierella polycephala TaxID=41804 RepID=A0A9P6PQF9_9FUNG|nr:hypothetical protein BG011_008786 [Mortierella polycephala]